MYGYVSLCCLVARCECTGSSSISWLQFQLLSQCFVEVTHWFRRKFNNTQLATIAKHVVFPDVNKTGNRVTQNKSYQLYLTIKSKLSDSNNLTISGDYSIKCRKTVSTIWINITQSLSTSDLREKNRFYRINKQFDLNPFGMFQCRRDFPLN